MGNGTDSTGGTGSSDSTSGTSSSRYATGDLRAAHLPEVDWAGDRRAALRELYRWVEFYAVETINWYTSNKVASSYWSRLLRTLATLFVVVGTVAPVVSVGMGWTKAAIWGYGLIAVGAACVGVDRVFGFSSSWMRHMSTAMALNRRLVQFQCTWAVLQATSGSTGGEDEPTGRAVAEIILFVEEFNAVVDSETLGWVSEFQANLTQLESVAAVPPPSRQ